MITIGDTVLTYSYEIGAGNGYWVALGTFSTNAGDSRAVAYDDFRTYSSYYGRSDYADHWISSAFDGDVTSFANDRVAGDFTQATVQGRKSKYKETFASSRE